MYYIGWIVIIFVIDGIIYLYINGKLLEIIIVEDDYYLVKSIFWIGDKVKIEVFLENGKYKVKVEICISVFL